MRVLVLSFLLLLLLPVAAEAMTMEEWKVYDQCKPMRLGVGVKSLPEDAKKIGLKEESIINLAESRLPAARIYNKDADSYLYVGVSMFREAFNVSLQYKKPVLFYNQWGMATTWDANAVGTHGGDANYILSAISEYMDKFILEYLKANEKDCK